MVLREDGFALHLGQLLGRNLHVRLEDADILLHLRELGFQLLHLVFVRPPIELEQRLPLFHRHVRLDEHGGDQGWLAETRQELDGVLNDSRVGGIRCHEPQADHEDEEQMQANPAGHHTPHDAELDPLELEEDEPHPHRIEKTDEQRSDHAGPAFPGFVSSVAGAALASGFGAGLPESRAMSSSMARASAAGKRRMSTVSVGLNAQTNA